MDTLTFQQIKPIFYGTQPPKNTRHLWYDTNSNQLYYYSSASSSWIPVIHDFVEKEVIKSIGTYDQQLYFDVINDSKIWIKAKTENGKIAIRKADDKLNENPTLHNVTIIDEENMYDFDNNYGRPSETTGSGDWWGFYYDLEEKNKYLIYFWRTLRTPTTSHQEFVDISDDAQTWYNLDSKAPGTSWTEYEDLYIEEFRYLRIRYNFNPSTYDNPSDDWTSHIHSLLVFDMETIFDERYYDSINEKVLIVQENNNTRASVIKVRIL